MRDDATHCPHGTRLPDHCAGCEQDADTVAENAAISVWTIEECGCFQDDWGRPVGWAVIDEDGAEIEFFREKEDAEDWLEERQAAAEMAAEDEWIYQQEIRLNA